MSWSADARNAMLVGLQALINRVGLADEAGTEQAGGVYSGPYVPTWVAPAGGQGTADPEVVTVNAGTLAWVRFMADAGVGPDVLHGMFPYMAGAAAPIIVPATVEDLGDLFTSPGHGLVDGNRVAVYPILGAALPTGLTGPPELYHVVSATADTFQVSETAGGGAVAISADGACWVHQGLPETFAAPGQTTTVTATLDARVV